MGEIIGYKVVGEKIVYKLCVDEKEALQLKGNINNIRLFTLDKCETESKIVEWGKNNSTKYFLIPKCFRKKTKKRPVSIAYQAIDLESKMIFIYELSY